VRRTKFPLTPTVFTISEPLGVIVSCFCGLFFARIWQHVQIFLLGAILCPGKRTVSAVLRVMGLSKERSYGKYHHVLSRAVWSSRKVARRLLVHLIATFVPSGVVVMGIDDTVERRSGAGCQNTPLWSLETAALPF
jgi:hypothetical protein